MSVRNEILKAFQVMHPHRLAVAGVTAAATALAVPVVAQANPTIDTKNGVYYHVDAESEGLWETQGSTLMRGRFCTWQIHDGVPYSESISDLAETLVDSGRADYGESAVVALHEGEYLVSWNCLPWTKID